MTGSGTINDPYIIYDVNDLQDIENDLTAYYELGQDIDASDTVTWNGGLGFLTLGGWAGLDFTGQLDGKGYKVTGLFFSVIGLPRMAGLFNLISPGSVIQDLGLEDVNISSQNMCAAFGRQNNGIIRRCHSTGVLYSEAPDCGGLIQDNGFGATIEKCYSDVDINCGVGGLGGGLVGTNDGTITNSYARGDIDALPFGVAGGLIGNNGATITNCYSTGRVTAAVGFQGGLVGFGLAAFAVNCFWDTETSGQATSQGGTGRTTAQMRTRSTFTDAGWDPVTIWGFFPGSYPCLRSVSPKCSDYLPQPVTLAATGVT